MFSYYKYKLENGYYANSGKLSTIPEPYRSQIRDYEKSRVVNGELTVEEYEALIGEVYTA